MREYGSEHPAVLLPDGYFDTFQKFGHCTWLRSGREALHLVALNSKGGKTHPVVLMPAYCCHSMVDPFEKAGWKVVYYRLNDDLTADIDYLTQLLVTVRPTAALTMNFFGSASTLDAVSHIKCGFPDCLCIEDFSHCTFSLADIYNPQVDYYVTSIRKSIGVCDGAVIIGHEPLDETCVEEAETEFVRARRDCQRLKARYVYAQDEGQKGTFFPELRRQEGELDNFSGVHRISNTGAAMLKSVNGEMIRYARQKNMEHLWSLLKDKVEMVPGLERSFSGAPFALPILVENRDEVQKKLARKGVYAPVLWPIADEARAVCPVSARMADRMLSIPVDQRYGYDDMEDIASIVLEMAGKKKLMVLAAGLLQIPVIKKAREMGVYVIAVDDDPAAPGMALADKAIVPGGLINEERLLAIAREEKVDGVIHPCSEVAMSVMGRINDVLHLHGISRETAVRATNKHLMREAFEKFGAPSPKSYCTADVEEGYKLFLSIGGKAILKPSRNSGSRGIAEIEPELTFEAFAPLFERSKAESRDASVMVEQFVEGPEFSVEIIVSHGVVNVLQVTDKKTTEAPYFVELGHSQPSLFAPDVVAAIKDAAVKGVKALQLNDCAAHAELKYQDGKPYIMEIGARLGGDFISTELTHLSTGIDMVAAAINVALGNEPCLEPVAEPQGVAIRYFTPVPGVVRAIEGEELLNRPDVYDAEIYVKPGDRVKEVKSSLDRSGHVIVTAPEVKDAIALAEHLVSSVKIVTE